MQTKLFELKFFIPGKESFPWGGQIILPACQFSWYPALNEIPKGMHSFPVKSSDN